MDDHQVDGNRKAHKKLQKKIRSGNRIMVLGLLLFIGAVALTAYNLYDGKRADSASQEVVKKIIEQTPKEDPQEDPPEERDMPTKTIDGYKYVGYLDIPSLDLHLPVMESCDMKRLKISPCRYSGSVYKDNMVIAGHNYRRHFSPLRYQGAGTKINFTDVEGNVYHYKISDVEILKPSQVGKMTKTSKNWDLTLFTCTIGGRTRHTIRCVRTDKEDAEIYSSKSEEETTEIYYEEDTDISYDDNPTIMDRIEDLIFGLMDRIEEMIS